MAHHDRPKRRTHAALAALAVLATTVTACTTTASGGPSGSSASLNGTGGTLTIANNSDPLSINPALAGIDIEGVYLQPAYEPLIELSPSGSMGPGLATAWKFSNANRHCELTIRQGVKFSNGTPLTAKTVAQSLQYWAGATGPFSHYLSGASIKATGADTVSIDLRASFPALLLFLSEYYTAGDIIAPEGVEHPSMLNIQTLGAGPYMLDPAETIADNTYVYIPNPNYYDKAAIHWHRIVIKVITNTSSALQALQAGQIQAMTGDSATAASLGNSSNIQVLASPVKWSGMSLFDWNGKLQPALADARVRQALNYAIDRKAITSALYGQYGQPSDQIVGPGDNGYNPGNDSIYPYDPAKAEQLLAEAGYPHGFTLSVVVQHRPDNDNLLGTLTEQLAKVGVKLRPTIVDASSQLFADVTSGNYSAWMETNNTMVPSGYLNYQFFNLIQAFGPPSGPSGQQLATMFNKASAASGPAATAQWTDLYQLVVDQGYYLPVSRSDIIFLLANSVQAQAPGATVYLDPLAITPRKTG
jgi:peptide/nickel transport system substrate-binding protein